MDNPDFYEPLKELHYGHRPFVVVSIAAIHEPLIPTKSKSDISRNPAEAIAVSVDRRLRSIA
jgi:hypothetical protein